MKYLLLFVLFAGCTSPVFYKGDKLLFCIDEDNPYEKTQCDTFTVLEVKNAYVLYVNDYGDTLSDRVSYLEMIVDKKLNQ